MSDTSSGNDWELVTGALSSHASSASSSSADGGGDGAGEGGTVDSNVGSGYFVCEPVEGASQHAELLSSGVTEQFTLVKPPTGEVQQQPADLRDEAAFSVGEGKQVEEIDFSRGILMSDSCTSQLHELSKLDWMEPRPPGAGHQLLEYEGNELGSTSNPDAYAPEIKAGLEPDSQQVGPLLGSCMSAPSSPSIVSRGNSFRLNLSDEIVGEVLGGSATSQRGFPMEVEPDALASVDHEVLLAHSTSMSSDSVAAMRKMGSASELENDRASETWWNKQAALRGGHGRQASTYWSIALAAAVMGLVILGHRWQYERRQNQQLRLCLCAKEEKIGQLILQLARMKEALSGRRRVPVLRSNYLNDSFDRY